MTAHPWLSELEDPLVEQLDDKPIVLMFGRKDPALARDRWRKQFTDATDFARPDAGHYIQEDAPNEIIGAVSAAFS